MLDAFPHRLTCLIDMIRCWLSTAIAIMLAAFWSVRLGETCRFYGSPIFRRLPNSQISIGSRCKFRSAKWSNFAGINHPCILATLAKNSRITIGDDCGFSGVSIGAASSVEIGNRVMVGANSSISDTDWHARNSQQRAIGGGADSRPVVIEDDVWLGANVVVLKGVRIGAGSVVAANSVVTKDIPSGVVACGVPARPVKAIADTVSNTSSSEITE